MVWKVRGYGPMRAAASGMATGPPLLTRRDGGPVAPDLAQRDPQVGVGCGVVDSQIWVPQKGSQSEGASHVRSPPYAPSPLTPPELPWRAPVAAVPRSPPAPVACVILYRKCAVVGAGRAAGRQDRPSGGDPTTPRSPGSHRSPRPAPRRRPRDPAPVTPAPGTRGPPSRC